MNNVGRHLLNEVVRDAHTVEKSTDPPTHESLHIRCHGRNGCSRDGSGGMVQPQITESLPLLEHRVQACHEFVSPDGGQNKD